VSRADYARLFAVIGNDYGAAPNADSFVLPNFRDHFLLPWRSPADIASQGGSWTHTITTAEMPGHAHRTGWGLRPCVPGDIERPVPRDASALYVDCNGGIGAGMTTVVGGGQAMPIQPPWAYVNCIIKY